MEILRLYYDDFIDLFNWPSVGQPRHNELGYYYKIKMDMFGCRRLYRGVYRKGLQLLKSGRHGASVTQKLYCLDVTAQQKLYHVKGDLYLIGGHKYRTNDCSLTYQSYTPCSCVLEGWT